MEHPKDVCLIVVRKNEEVYRLLELKSREHNHIMNHTLDHNVYACYIHRCCMDFTTQQTIGATYIYLHALKTEGRNRPVIYKYTF